MGEIRRVRVLLIPTKEQEYKFWDYVYHFRKIYNLGLEWNNKEYKENKKFIFYNELSSKLTQYKKENKELYEIDSHTLKEAMRNVSESLTKFNKGLSKYPRFKNSKTARKSFYTRQDKVVVSKNTVKLSSLGLIKSKSCHKLLDELLESNKEFKIYKPYVIYDGKYWFLSIGLDVNYEKIKLEDKSIGIDLGVEKTITTSEYKYYLNINKSRKVLELNKRKKRLQKKISRKYEKNKSGNKFIKTKNIKKSEKKLRLLDRKIVNIRENYNHEILNDLIRGKPKVIVIEDLKVRNMLKNRHLSRVIQEQNFRRLRSLLKEKCNNKGVELKVVPTFFASSKICSGCCNKKIDLKLSDRIYKCNHCGLELDRDLNAAINIRDYFNNLK